MDVSERAEQPTETSMHSLIEAAVREEAQEGDRGRRSQAIERGRERLAPQAVIQIIGDDDGVEGQPEIERVEPGQRAEEGIEGRDPQPAQARHEHRQKLAGTVGREPGDAHVLAQSARGNAVEHRLRQPRQHAGLDLTRRLAREGGREDSLWHRSPRQQAQIAGRELVRLARARGGTDEQVRREAHHPSSSSSSSAMARS